MGGAGGGVWEGGGGGGWGGCLAQRYEALHGDGGYLANRYIMLIYYFICLVFSLSTVATSDENAL